MSWCCRDAADLVPQRERPYWFYFILKNYYYYLLFRAAPKAYGGSQARGLNWSYSCQPTSQPQQRRIWAVFETHTTAHGNARSLTHWVSPGIKPATSWFLVRFISSVPWWELLSSLKNDAKELIHKTETDSKDFETKLMVTRGEMWSGMDWEVGVDICTLLYTKLISNGIAQGNLFNTLW